ncbi:tyrosine-type recombinase/integrase [Nonomuraea recticatena]|uniref:tyrosine-type recombinase/integrase n=1 Tax=Nonomuraea recticatena TaxID=46178 RepID=UPI00361C003F
MRHTCAKSLLQAGVDTSVLALWLGHAGIRSTDAYLHADMSIKEKALALTTPQEATGRYHPPTRSSRFSKVCDHAEPRGRRPCSGGSCGSVLGIVARSA